MRTPEIGAMSRLELFTPYTSYRLHWFPYEITRCPSLRDSTVSTRALYGNHKLRPPFPRLQPQMGSTTGLDCTTLDPGTWGATAILTCSVCGESTCLDDLPTPHAGYVSTLHTGGGNVPQADPF
jgi:hypothetical protein